jgi:hypothetical protein
VLNSVNRLIFVTVKCGVYFAVRTERTSTAPERIQLKITSGFEARMNIRRGIIRAAGEGAYRSGRFLKITSSRKN